MAAVHDLDPIEARLVPQWSDAADVVVLGGGAAGASAALEASAAGVDVLVLNAADDWGGAAVRAGGSIYLGGGTALQRACGVDDTAENMFAFLCEATGPDPDRAKLATYCENSREHFDWLVRHGVEFAPRLWDEPCWAAPRGYGLMYTGGEAAYPFAECFAPAARGHMPDASFDTTGTRSAGWALMHALGRAAASTSIRRRDGTRVERLVLADGHAVGVQLAAEDGSMFVRARRGVVLAGGGFAANDAMLAQHAPQLLGNAMIGSPTDDGTVIRMAQAAGAAVRHMSAGQTAFPADPRLLTRAALLDARARRFVNEDTYPGRAGQLALFRQGRQTFLLFDQAIEDEAVAAGAPAPTPTWVSGDLATLAGRMGVSAAALESTVAEYNLAAERGHDAVAHKSARWLRRIDAPYRVLDLRDVPYGVFTLGGLHTDVDARVLHLDGSPIPGLYAAGRTTSGVAAWGYSSGTSIGDSTFFGRRAGRAAAAG